MKILSAATKIKCAQKQKNPELTKLTVRLGAPPWPPPPPLRPKAVFKEVPEMGTLQQC